MAASKHPALRYLASALGLLLVGVSLSACKTMPEAMNNVPFLATLTQKELGPLDPLPAPSQRAYCCLLGRPQRSRLRSPAWLEARRWSSSTLPHRAS